MSDRGGRGSRIGENRLTSFVNAPLVYTLSMDLPHRNIALFVNRKPILSAWWLVWMVSGRKYKKVRCWLWPVARFHQFWKLSLRKFIDHCENQALTKSRCVSWQVNQRSWAILTVIDWIWTDTVSELAKIKFGCVARSTLTACTLNKNIAISCKLTEV